MVQSHLDEVAWRKMRKLNPYGLLAAFLKDAVNMYDCDTNLPSNKLSLFYLDRFIYK